MWTDIGYAAGGLAAVVALGALIVWVFDSWFDGGWKSRAASTTLLCSIIIAGVTAIIWGSQHADDPGPNCIQQDKVATVYYSKYGPRYSTEWKCEVYGKPGEVMAQ